MDVVYARGNVTAREVLDALPDPPGYSSVRKLLSLLVEKNVLKTKSEGRALVYSPVTPRSNAAKSALQKIVDTFFGGSVSAAMSGLIDLGEDAIQPEELQRLKEKIKQSEDNNKK